MNDCIHITKWEYVPASAYETDDEIRNFSYVSHAGLTLCESRGVPAYSDVPGKTYERISSDNGKTWSPWEDKTKSVYTYFGEDEMFPWSYGQPLWNPVHCHTVKVYVNRLGIGGAVAAEKRYWEGKLQNEHTYLQITDADGRESLQMVRYEDGPAFVPGGAAQEYAEENLCSCAYFTFMKNGDILLPLGVPASRCSLHGGPDWKTESPEIDGQFCGLMVARGTFNKASGTYDFTFSRPVVPNSYFVSRGVCETTVAELQSGRILIVFRGSKAQSDAWGTRVEDHMPPVKWYIFSDDGGITFTPPMPWHFDTCEFFYSSASLSQLVRSEKNGRLYWIGNITGPDAWGNAPRWPLYICEVDEKWGVLKKDTLTVIDTKAEDESNSVEFSNFNIYQDRETGKLEMMLTKRAAYDLPDGNTAPGGIWRYTIELPD